MPSGGPDEPRTVKKGRLSLSEAVLRWPVVVRIVTNVFWAAFLADGVVSLLDEIFFGGGVSSALYGARVLTATTVVLASLGVALMVAVTPKAPKRVLVPLVLFTWWAGLAQVFPLGFLKIPQFMLWISLTQIALAALIFVFFRGRESRWMFAEADRPAFRWRHALLGIPLAAALFAVFAVLAVFTGLSGQLETVSGGYVRLRPDGIYLLERRFQAGDREVRLSGMMHIAEEEFYTDLLPADDPAMPSVVLIEGVTDQDNRLGEEGLSYSRLASMLSISSQEDSIFMEKVAAGLRRHRAAPSREESRKVGHGDGDPAGAMDFVHADVDVNTFHPKTIAFVVAVMSLFQAEDWPAFVKKFSETSDELNDESSQAQVIQDILHSRNERLVSEIQVSLKDYRRVIIPWGALHLTGVESWLRQHNFVQSGETERKALGFW